MKNKILLSVLLIWSAFDQAPAQLSEPGIPACKSMKMAGNIDFIDLPPVDPGRFYLTENENDLSKPLHYAVMIETAFDMDHSGKWTILPDGSKIWRIGIRSAGAFSLSLIFHNYHIPPGGRVFLYNAEMTNIFGAFTEKNNKPDNILPVAPFPGEKVIVEYDEPATTGFRGTLEIAEVGHDFRNIFRFIEKDGSYGHSGSCNVDINCPEGDQWQREKHSVCRLLTGGTLCSGSLVNNTANDGTPYFLTADHCLSSQTAASNLILYFNYESPSCHGPDGSVSQTVAGSTLKATTNALDFSLVELDEIPPASFNPYYAGWNNLAAAAKRTVCIHHPQGDVKKISKDYDPPVTGDYGATYDVNSHWQILAWDLGTTEGGSSGSPLFDEYHRIVGDLTGGEATCASSVNDYFAKFCRSWADYSDQSQQLKHWLDPGNTGVANVNGYDPYYGNNLPVADFVASSTTVMAGSSISFYDLSVGNVTSWLWSFPNAVLTMSTSQHPNNISYLTPGIYPVSLTVTNATGSNTLTRTTYITVTVGCEIVSNIAQTETLALYGFGSGEWGYWSGQNQHNFTDFAEKYTSTEGHFVYGVNITAGKTYFGNSNSYITIKVWSGGALPGNELYSEHVLISQFTPGVAKYISFIPTVSTGGDFFVGYEVNYNAADTFAVLHAFPRGAGGTNTFFVMMNGNWNPVTTYSSTFTTSLKVEPKVCGMEDIDQIAGISECYIYPNPSTGIFNISLNNMESPVIRVFDVLGKEIRMPKSNINGNNEAIIDISACLPGLYYVIINQNEKKITGKLMLIR
ncbi:MAG: T9SS type A sorting domain-containing protein [Bacteroidia bacterium]|nr:T9SS type A sorting domain-containing protein [Bacteroidia bacterium]